MSASLVGSEMCIRDRGHVEAHQGARSIALAQLGDGLYGQTLCQESQAEAVSYTHLTLPTICSV
eukprot:12342907-Alexandrium_andersonii.AAC.1